MRNTAEQRWRLRINLAIALALFAFGLTSCATKHVVVPKPPSLSMTKADYSNTELWIYKFTVTNMSIRDRAEDIDLLRGRLIDYLSAQSDFRSVHKMTPSTKLPDSANCLLAEVRLAPEHTNRRTYILDLLNFCPCIPGLWPLTPLWGKVTVDGSLILFDREANLITQINSRQECDYSIFLYSWYRSAPIEEKLAECYGKVFYKFSSGVATNRESILSMKTTATIVDVSQGKTEMVTASSKLPEPTWRIENVAIAKFTTYALSENESLTLAEALRTTLVETKYFRIMSRDDMNAILREQKFQFTGSCDDTQCLIEMGRLLPVQKIIGGTIGKVGNTFQLTLKIINLETGEIEQMAKRTVKGEADQLLSLADDMGKDFAIQYGLKKKKQ